MFVTGAERPAERGGTDAGYVFRRRSDDRPLRRARARLALQVRRAAPARAPGHRGAALRQQADHTRVPGVPRSARPEDRSQGSQRVRIDYFFMYMKSYRGVFNFEKAFMIFFMDEMFRCNAG